MTDLSLKKKSYCISHSKDVDGLASAAMVLAAKPGPTIFRLTDYDGLFAELDLIPEDVDDFTLCDLGTDPGRFDSLVRKLGKKSRKISVTYIDHHYLSDDAKSKIRESGVRLIHDPSECSGTLTYRFFEKELPPAAKLLALYAAVTDYMDGSTVAKRLMERHDRQMVLFEATLLALAVAKRGGDQEFLRSLVGDLSSMKMPHTIAGVPAEALDQAEVLRSLAKHVAVKGKVIGKIAYMETDQYSTGSIAKLLLGAKDDVPLAAAFRRKRRKGWYEVSLRGTSDVKVHLGKVVGEIARRYGGNGGGHQIAAGCSVPKGSIMAVLADLNKVL